MTNPNLRQDNNRISRKITVFSKKEEALNCQMTLYFANFNFRREHRSLGYEDENGITKFNSPARRAGLIRHVLSPQEMLTFQYHKNSNLLEIHDLNQFNDILS